MTSDNLVITFSIDLRRKFNLMLILHLANHLFLFFQQVI